MYMWPTDRKQFLATWKDLPPTNEVQSTIAGCSLTADAIQQKLESNNVFMIARRSVDVGGVPQVIDVCTCTCALLIVDAGVYMYETLFVKQYLWSALGI